MNTALAAARMSDPIEHPKSMMGFLVGAAVGLAVGVAMVAAVVATGGAALAVIAVAGAAVATTGGGALAGAALGGTFGDITGTVAMGAATVQINGLLAARAMADGVICSRHSPVPPPIAAGSDTVFIEGHPAARKTDAVSCGATINNGSPDVLIGASTVQYLEVASEIPSWMTTTATWMMYGGSAVALGFGAGAAFAAGGLCAVAHFGGTVAMSMAGSIGGGYVGGEVGFAVGGERGEIIGQIAGSLIGGFTGARMGSRTFSGHPVDVATGELMTEATDFTLPGPIPLVWQRVWLSSSTQQGELGSGWHHNFDMQIVQLPEEHDRQLAVRLQDGHIALFVRPEAHCPSFNRGEQLILHFANDTDEQDGYRLQDFDGLDYVFSATQNKTTVPTYLLDRVEDEYRHTIQLHRNHKDQLDGMTDSAGRRLQLERSTDGRTLQSLSLVRHGEHAPHRLVQYQVSHNDLTAVTDGNGHSTHFRYTHHLIVEERHRDGFSYHFDWDDSGRGRKARCTETWGGSRVAPRQYRRLSYQPDTRITEVIDGRETTMVYHSNDRGLVEQEVWPNGDRVTTRFDADGLVLSRNTGGVDETSEYDTLGRLVVQQTTDGQATRYHYAATTITADGHSYNNVKALTLANGASHLYKYDALGALTHHTDPEGRQTRYLRDANSGFIEAINGINGDWQRYRWTDSGLLSQIHHPQGGQQHFEYDPLGNLIHEQLDQILTAYSYDANGNCVALERNDGQRQAWQFNPENHVVAHTLEQPDQSPVTTQWHYEGNAITRRTNPDGSVFRYEYDSDYNLTALINARSERYQLDYDENERLVREVGFDGRVQQYGYNRAGQLEHWQDNDRCAHYSRDKADRLTAIQYYHAVDPEPPRPLDAEAVATAMGSAAFPEDAPRENAFFAYDVLGRLTRAVNGHRRVQFRYNLSGDLIEERQDGHTLAHHFDQAGQKTRTTLPDGRHLTFHYNDSHQLSALDLDEHRLVDHHYDSYGRERHRQCGELRIDSEYDPMGRLSRQQAWKAHLSDASAQRQPTHQAIQQRQYHYNALDQLTEQNDLLKGSKRYHYSARQQLIRVTGEQQDRYDFDPAGQLIDVRQSLSERDTEVGLPSSPASSRGGQPPITGGRLTRQGDRHYEYDGRGNRVTQRRGKNHAIHTAYQYNLANELSAVIETRGHWQHRLSFAYDALGRRIHKSVTIEHVQTGALKAQYEDSYLWMEDVLLQETRRNLIDSPAGIKTINTARIENSTTLYLHEPASFRPLLQLHCAADTDERVYYYQLDHIGTPLTLTSVAGDVVWSADYSGFGIARPSQGNRARNPIRFQGQYEDEEVGLYYNRFRYYDPLSGQYTQQDPIGLNGGTSLLSQFVNDPVQWIDPLGLSPLDGFDATGRPLSSPNYSVWHESTIPKDVQTGSRKSHFRAANQELHQQFKANPGMSQQFPPEVVKHVQPGPRGGFSPDSPPKHSWHHNAQDPAKIQLIPRKQHQAPGSVQKSLHPGKNGGGGYNVLTSKTCK